MDGHKGQGHTEGIDGIDVSFTGSAWRVQLAGIKMKPYSVIDPGLFVQKDQCFISPCDRLGVVVIRKSLSSVLKTICADNGFRQGTIDQNKKRTYMVVLRDPLERWYASVHWYLGTYGISPEKIDQNLCCFMINNCCWDDHTLPQYYYLTAIPKLDQIKAIDFAPGLFDKISDTMKSFGYNSPKLDWNHTTKEMPLACETYTPEQITDKIQEFYNQDYWLRHWLLGKPVPDKILASAEELV